MLHCFEDKDSLAREMNQKQQQEELKYKNAFKLFQKKNMRDKILKILKTQIITNNSQYIN